MSSTTISELCAQLRLLLKSSPDDASNKELLQRVETFVVECSASPESSFLLHQLEEELQVVCHDLLSHTLLPQAGLFLAFLSHLRPILPARSIISTWFELVLRPALREPRLPKLAAEHAKQLILSALDPGSNFSDAEEGSEEAEKQKEQVGNFRRRLMDLYLLDAFNESSGDDVLEWAQLSQQQREAKSCWKTSLEDVLVTVGNERPQDLLNELYLRFDSPESRLQLLILLSAYTLQSDFPKHAHALASHPLMTSLLHCLVFDTSSTVCTIALTIVTKLLPIFAVNACEHLKRLLPHLLVVLARILCWRERQPSKSVLPTFPYPDPEDSDGEGSSQPDMEGLSPRPDTRHELPVREDLEWRRLELMFDGPESKAPSPHRYFTFLYYLFPCNTIRFLRYPVRYLEDNGMESVYAVEWDVALDVDKIRSKSELLLRMHVLHPLLIWREPREELEEPEFWAKYDIPRIVGGATMLDVRNAAFGLRQQQQESSLVRPLSRLPSVERGRPFRPRSAVEEPPDAEDPGGEEGEGVPLSSSLETMHPGAVPEIPATADPVRPKVSLADMVATSVALRSGLDIDIVDPSPSWSATLFPLQPRTRSPSRSERDSSQEGDEPVDTPGTPAVAEYEQSGDGTLPPHVAQAISGLQREVLLLKNDLNLELWTARENVKHIGRLYTERVLSRSEESERQGLHNKLKEYKNEVSRLQQQLKEAKSQAVARRDQYTSWTNELRERLTMLRNEKKAWTSEAAAMRATQIETQDTFAAQGKLLADATRTVFRLETQIKENAHKVDRLYDYETQVDQLMKLQRLWESDVRKLNDSKEYIAAFASTYRKMELRLDEHEQTHRDMVAHMTAQEQQLRALERTVEHYKKESERFQRTADLHHQAELRRSTSEANKKLRDENEELRDEIEELKAMLEVLKRDRSGRMGLIDLDSPRSSPPLTL